MTIESWPLPSFPNRFSISARPRKSDMTDSHFCGRFVWPLEDHVDADGTVGDAILVGRDQRNRAYQLPSFRASIVNPRIQPADHPLITFAEYHHPIKIFPLHRLTPSLLYCHAPRRRAPLRFGPCPSVRRANPRWRTAPHS